MTRWEYYVYTRKKIGKLFSSEWEAKPDLKELGNDGWELINVVPASHEAGEFFAGTTTSLTYYFKRPIEE